MFGVFLGAVGFYDKIFEIFGCGISIPLIGFGGNIANGVKEAIDKEGFLGIFKGALSASSAGLTLSLLAALVASLFSKGKSKKL